MAHNRIYDFSGKSHISSEELQSIQPLKVVFHSSENSFRNHRRVSLDRDAYIAMSSELGE